MLINDVNGKFSLKVNHQRGIVFEKNMGLWDSEDFTRYHNVYVSKIAPLFKGKKWAKCSDLTEYKTSNIADDIKEHIVWAEKNGFACGAIVIDSAITKMQMNRSKNQVAPNSFSSEDEADTWLKSQGF